MLKYRFRGPAATGVSLRGGVSVRMVPGAEVELPPASENAYVRGLVARGWLELLAPEPAEPKPSVRKAVRRALPAPDKNPESPRATPIDEERS